MKISAEELYFKDSCIQGIYEYEPENFLVCVKGRRSVNLVNRRKMQVTQTISLPGSGQKVKDLKLVLIPGMKKDKNKFVMVRDFSSVYILNLRTKKAVALFTGKL